MSRYCRCIACQAVCHHKTLTVSGGVMCMPMTHEMDPPAHHRSLPCLLHGPRRRQGCGCQNWSANLYGKRGTRGSRTYRYSPRGGKATATTQFWTLPKYSNDHACINAWQGLAVNLFEWESMEIPLFMTPVFIRIAGRLLRLLPFLRAKVLRVLKVII